MMKYISEEIYEAFALVPTLRVHTVFLPLAYNHTRKLWLVTYIIFWYTYTKQRLRNLRFCRLSYCACLPLVGVLKCFSNRWSYVFLALTHRNDIWALFLALWGRPKRTCWTGVNVNFACKDGISLNLAIVLVLYACRYLCNFQVFLISPL